MHCSVAIAQMQGKKMIIIFHYASKTNNKLLRIAQVVNFNIKCTVELQIINVLHLKLYLNTTISVIWIYTGTSISLSGYFCKGNHMNDLCISVAANLLTTVYQPCYLVFFCPDGDVLWQIVGKGRILLVILLKYWNIIRK